MSAEVSGDPEYLLVKRIQGQARVRWEDIVRVAAGGGNLVLYTKNGRVTAPSFEFWAGENKPRLLALMRGKLEGERQVHFDGNSLRAMFHVGDR